MKNTLKIYWCLNARDRTNDEKKSLMIAAIFVSVDRPSIHGAMNKWSMAFS